MKGFFSITLSLVCICILGYFSLLNFLSIEKEYDDFIVLNNEMKMYQLSDSLIGEAEQEYFQKNDYTNVQNFYYDLNEKFEKEYIYSFDQEMNIYDFRGNLDFSEFYIESWGEERLKQYTINAVQVNQNAVDYYNVKATNGYTFNTSDFVIQKDLIVPVILGSDFIGIYEVGDIFEGSYLTDDLKFEVKGFLSKDQKQLIRMNLDEVNLNRYVVLPVIEDDNNLLSTSFNKWNSLQLINGFLMNNDGDFINLFRLTELSSENSLPNPYLIGVNRINFLINKFIETDWLVMIILVISFITLIYIYFKINIRVRMIYDVLHWIFVFIFCSIMIIWFFRFISLKLIILNIIFMTVLYLIKFIFIKRYSKSFK